MAAILTVATAEGLIFCSGSDGFALIPSDLAERETVLRSLSDAMDLFDSPAVPRNSARIDPSHEVSNVSASIPTPVTLSYQHDGAPEVKLQGGNEFVALLGERDGRVFGDDSDKFDALLPDLCEGNGSHRDTGLLARYREEPNPQRLRLRPRWLRGFRGRRAVGSCDPDRSST